MGHGQAPPSLPKGFGPPAFTPADQAANPDKPMTRLVKDVLRVGKWKVGEDANGNPVFWNVGKKTLDRIANNVRQAQSRGVALNLGKTHGDAVTKLIHPNDLIAPYDQVIVEGDTLWISVYVTPEQARYLSNPAMKVSPGVYDNWQDGLGNIYPTQLIHVAVTDSPVVTGQGPFVALSNRQSPNAKGVTMADEATTTETDEAPAADSAENENLLIEGPGVDALIKEIGMMLPGDVGLPSDTTGETLVRDLRLIRGAVMQEPAAEPSAETVIDTPGDLPAELANQQLHPAVQKALADQAKQIKTLSNQVASLSKQANTAPRALFIRKMQELGRQGVEAKFLHNRLRTAEKLNDYDLSHLDGLVSGVTMANVARSKATADPPKLETEKPKHAGIGVQAFGPQSSASRR